MPTPADCTALLHALDPACPGGCYPINVPYPRGAQVDRVRLPAAIRLRR